MGLTVPQHARVVGVDLVERFSVSGTGRIQLMRCDAARLPFTNASFELIISRSVFEHLDRPEEVFREIGRLLVPGGRFVLLTPNRWDYVSLGATLVPNAWHPWLVGRMTGRAEHDTFPTRYRANTVGKLSSLAKAAGLEVVELSHLREHPHYLQFNSLAYGLGVCYEQTAQRFVRGTRPWIIGTFRRTSG